MKALKKKKEQEDMLITHKLSKEQEKNKTGRESVSGKTMGKEMAKELEQMKKRLTLTSDQKEIEFVLEMIQRQFGNETAEKIISEMRLLKDDEENLQKEKNTPDRKETKE